jgi:prolycopene isomerase
VAETETIGGFDAIIIGAGMGGLVAGNALAMRGFSVLIVDRQKIPGGCTTNFRRRGFRFDASTHLLNGCGPGGVIHEGLRKIGAQDLVEFIEVETLMLWRDLVNGRDIRLPTALADHVDKLAELFPHQAKGVRDFYSRYGRVVEFLFSGANPDAAEPPADDPEHAAVMDEFFGLQGKTAKDILDPYVSDRELREMMTILTGFFGLGYDEIDAFTFLAGDLSYRLSGQGAYYPKGGSGHFSAVLADLFQQRGGTLILNRRVTQLTFADGRVDGIVAVKPSGRRIAAKSRCVIANSDVTALVSEISPPGVFPDDYVQSIRDRVPCCSAVVLYAGLDFDLRERGIRDYEIHATWGEESTSELLNEIARTGDYSRIPCGSVTAYSNIDPSCCPEGKSVIATICFADPEVFEATLVSGKRRSEAYQALKRRIISQLLAKMGRTLQIPDLESHVEAVELATPLTMKHYTLHRNGSFVGWKNTPDQGGFNSIPQQSPVENLFLCGHWVFPAGGVSPVIMGGNNAADLAVAYLSKDN